MTGTYPSTRSGSTRVAGPDQCDYAPRSPTNSRVGWAEAVDSLYITTTSRGGSLAAVVVKVGATAQDRGPTPLHNNNSAAKLKIAAEYIQIFIFQPAHNNAKAVNTENLADE